MNDSEQRWREDRVLSFIGEMLDWDKLVGIVLEI